MDTLYEEAARCPSCKQPGKLLNVRTARVPASVATPGTKMHLLECHNDRCPDFVSPERVGTTTVIPGSRYRWYVQVNPDGTVPPKGSGSTGPKAFDTEDPRSNLAQQARDNLRYLAARDERKGEAFEIGRDLGYE